MPVDRKYIKERALDYANVPLIDRRVVASVHLENRDDELFWDTLLQHHKEGKYNFIYESRVEKDSSPHSGVDQCLRYKAYLSSTFFICIDSDLRYLLQETNIDANHFIIQTYTYSWENHYCIAEHIQKRIKELAPEAATKFDFVHFLSNLSKYAYEPFIYLLEAVANHSAPNNMRKQFRHCIPSQCSALIFNDNGALFLSQIKQELLQFKNNPLFASIDLKAAKQKYKTLGITESNAYLHLRGHNIWSLTNSIGTILCKSYKINFKEQILIPSLQLAGNWQIEKIHTDIQSII
ncbi:MAG: DUF4435 domain-containing protein [Paludibacteraceae bacterium]|jgi:hypothetical protein|nr:DUF4435 domain-containing protein [Paludibacteraceae bacterium]